MVVERRVFRQRERATGRYELRCSPVRQWPPVSLRDELLRYFELLKDNFDNPLDYIQDAQPGE